MNDTFIALISVAVGTVSTGIVSYFLQSSQFNRQKEFEIEKQKTQHIKQLEVQETQYKQQLDIQDKQHHRQLEILKDQFKREEIAKKLEAYNEILKVNNDVQVIEWNSQTGESIFHSEPYNHLIRPLLYKNFHLLEEDIAKAVQEIDNTFLKWQVLGEGDDFDNEELCKRYLAIITSIEMELNDYRKTFQLSWAP